MMGEGKSWQEANKRRNVPGTIISSTGSGSLSKPVAAAIDVCWYITVFNNMLLLLADFTFDHPWNTGAATALALAPYVRSNLRSCPTWTSPQPSEWQPSH